MAPPEYSEQELPGREGLRGDGLLPVWMRSGVEAGESGRVMPQKYTQVGADGDRA